MRRKRILFVYTSFSSFVETDYKILSKFADVKQYKFASSKKIFKMIFEQVKLKIFLLINIWSCDIIYCWFADYHSFLPILFSKLFKKKSMLVLGGYDVTYIPELKYGSFSTPLRSFCAKYSMKMATVNLSVSDYIQKEALKIDPNLNVELCYNGVDSHKFFPSSAKKENVVLTVGKIDTEQRIKIKGINSFCEVASKLPEYKFVIVGMSDKAKNYLINIPENLQIFQSIEHNELLQYYQKAKVYCQFSVIESFCIALAEAMLCECVGIVTNVGALPEIVTDCGIVLENRNVNSAEMMIRKAMNLNSELGGKASRKIKENYSFEKREARLIELINAQLNN